MIKKKTVIIDMGVCNIFNIRRAVESVGADAVITSSIEKIKEASSLILPGVGAFGAAITRLKDLNLIEPIQEFIKTGKPVFGICLGMQLLMENSNELGFWTGLGVIPGEVRAFVLPDKEGPYFKIPQIGWNVIERNIDIDNSSQKDNWRGTILDDVGAHPYVYFIHSYVVKPKFEKHVLAYTRYGNDKFCSVIQKDNIVACQFHPERSGEVGLRLLRNFFKQV